MKSEDSMTTRTRRHYTKEFTAEAVRLVGDSARPVALIAQDIASPTICFTTGGLSSVRRNRSATTRVDLHRTGRVRTADTNKRDAETGAGLF